MESLPLAKHQAGCRCVNRKGDGVMGGVLGMSRRNETLADHLTGHCMRHTISYLCGAFKS